jgi:hypothetical protein
VRSYPTFLGEVRAGIPGLGAEVFPHDDTSLCPDPPWEPLSDAERGPRARAEEGPRQARGALPRGHHAEARTSRVAIERPRVSEGVPHARSDHPEHAGDDLVEPPRTPERARRGELQRLTLLFDDTLRDVATHRHEVCELAFDEDGLGVHGDPVGAAIPSVRERLGLKALPAQDLGAHVLDRVHVRGAPLEKGRERLAAELVERPPGEPREALVRPLDATVGVGHEDGVRAPRRDERELPRLGLLLAELRALERELLGEALELFVGELV